MRMTHKLLPITLEDAKKDYEKLEEITCDTLKKIPPKSKIGNDAVDYFTYQERLNTKGNKHISFFDLYTNKNFFMKKTYIKNILAYLKNKSPNKTDLQIWRQIMGLYFGMPHIFKPLVAMEFYCRFKPNTVLDFTMGWGGRLLGACALDVPHYIGIDMNDHLRHPYEQMVKMVKPLTKTKITLMFKDALSVDYSKLDYDMVFTSPPYYNIELYNKTAQQSKDEWDANFYDPIIRKTFDGMKMGGHYCLNIPQEVYERVASKILGKADIKNPLNKQQRQAVAFKGGTAYTEYVYIWIKKNMIKGEGISHNVKEYEAIFKQYPNVFPSGYFRFLKARLQKHIQNHTLIYKNGVLLTWIVYKNSVKKTPKCIIKKGDVKLDQIVNKNQGNGAAKKVIEEFLEKFKTNRIWLEVRDDNKRAIQFYKDRGFKKMDNISFGKDIGGLIMLKEPSV